MDGVIASVTELLLAALAYRHDVGGAAPQSSIYKGGHYIGTPTTDSTFNTWKDFSRSRLYFRGGFDSRLVPFMFHNIILTPNNIAP